MADPSLCSWHNPPPVYAPGAPMESSQMCVECLELYFPEHADAVKREVKS